MRITPQMAVFRQPPRKRPAFLQHRLDGIEEFRYKECHVFCKKVGRMFRRRPQWLKEGEVWQ